MLGGHLGEAGADGLHKQHKLHGAVQSADFHAGQGPLIAEEAVQEAGFLDKLGMVRCGEYRRTEILPAVLHQGKHRILQTFCSHQAV
ncbi:hypothetical protein D3C81_2011080 [compost metagenome]